MLYALARYSSSMSYIFRLYAALLAIAALLCCGGNFDRQREPLTIYWRQVQGTDPAPRWGHVAVFDSRRDRALIFGGTTGTMPLNDVWSFSFATGQWSEIPTSNTPMGRWGARAVFDSARDRLIVVGGSLGSPSASNEVWQLPLTTGIWSQLPRGPSARFDLDSAMIGNTALFFGGFDNQSNAYNDLWQFDLGSDTWAELPAQNAPAPRTNATAGIWKGSFFVTGGHDASGVTPGSFRYDLQSDRWLDLSPFEKAAAGAHASYDTDSDCGQIVQFGGDHDDDKNTDATVLWNLTTGTTNFTSLADHSPPRKRRHASLVLEPKSRTLLLFGGLDTGQTLGDTWIALLPGCEP